MTTMTGSSSGTGHDGAVSDRNIAEFRTSFEADPSARIAQNAVTSTDINDVALNRSIVTNTDFSFSTLLDDWKVTNQKQSGRCWMFAALNLMRVGTMKIMNLKSFEFSQNYMFFWDKFERANYFLEQIIDTADRDLDDRTVAFMLGGPIDDGGQWNMFMNLVRRHGVVPQSVMPETQSSSSSGRMNASLKHKLREGARTLRGMVADGRSSEEIVSAKQAMLGTIWRILCVHLGTPPTEFDWQWNDKDQEFHREGRMTPQTFAAKYVDLPLDDFVCLVNDPRPSSPYGRTFTVDRLGNVMGGEKVLYLNIEIDLMKSITRSVLESGEPVWFGCDVGPHMQRKLGLWDRDLFKYEDLYGEEFSLDKAGRLEHHQSLMTHAMLFTGVDVVDGTSRRWRVENSWGAERSGRKGFYTMNDSWFDEYMFEIAARRSGLPQELQSAFEQEPIVLPAWDPMGSLAR
jgi:bleomycin hydrolase